MRNPTYSQDVAEEIRALLARRSLAQGWLADQIGVADSTLSRRLTGHSKFLVDDVVAIAAALNVDVRDIMPSLERGAA